MIDELDYIAGSDGVINYSEFLAATLDVKTFFNDTKLRAVFQMFDGDGNGSISEENMRLAFQKLGYELSRNEIHAMMKKHDVGMNGTLEFEEFKILFGLEDKNSGLANSIKVDRPGTVALENLETEQ